MTIARFATLAAVLAACNVDGPPLPEHALPRPAPSTPVEPADDEPIAAAEPTPAPPDMKLEDGLEVRPAIRDGRMAVIPIVATKPVTDRQFLTLQDGMRRGLVTVREMPGEMVVETVRVTNHSSQPLFVATGEIIVEAKQDRATAEDRVIEAGLTVELEVKCVESDRDHGGMKFAPGNAIAELAVRRELLNGSQVRVWSEVDRITQETGLTGSTKTYRLAAQRLATQPNPRRDRIASELAKLPERDKLVGFAVAVDGQVIAMERYATPSLYRQLEPHIVASYAAHPDGERIEGGRVSVDAIRELARTPSTHSPASVTALRRDPSY